MGRYPCCKEDDDNLKKGPWTEDEDEKLIDYIKQNGHTNWQSLARKAGLNRCGKSCRLRWNNYLRPDIKRGRFSPEEEEIIINLHSDLGNKWSKIAAHLPGRTDNEIKNFYNTHLRKKLLRLGIDPKTHKPISKLNSLVNLSHHLTSNSNYFLSLASVLSLQAQFSLLAKIQQVIQSPLPTINTINLLSSIQGNILSNSSPQLESLRNETEMSKFLDSSLANTTTTPCLDNTNLVLPNDYSSISNFSDDPLGTFDKIGTIQKRLVCPKHQDNGTQRMRNGPNFTNFCQANELDSSANCVEGLAKSSNIDTIYLFPSLVPSTPENSNLNQNDIPTFSELDDISAWEVPEDDEAITSFWNSIF